MLLRCAHCKELFDGVVRPDQTAACPRCGRAFDTTASDTIRQADRPVDSPLLEDAGTVTPAAESGASYDAEDTTRAAGARPPLPAELLLTPGQTFDKFAIVHALGKGGMGSVFKAYQADLDRHVALKVLNTRLARDEEFVRRFAIEARALGRLQHPGIIGVHDCDRFQGVPYIVMELVDGASLRARIKDRSLSTEEALRVVYQICEALEYAHEKGVLHRDVKPENILLDARGQVRIGDFGLARLVRTGGEKERLTQSRVVMGTMDYMAPEQRECTRDVDRRADIYAIGVILYEAVFGKLPLGRFELPDDVALGYPGLNEVILKALAQAPERRYSTAKEMGAALWEVMTSTRKQRVPAARVKEITAVLHALGSVREANEEDERAAPPRTAAKKTDRGRAPAAAPGPAAPASPPANAAPAAWASAPAGAEAG
ncbi:MAG: serine/threonine protein kinase, partial [Planctomycetes bacterium]|nr:serine/threonine protein kinase [Planctomycetota bacterium]